MVKRFNIYLDDETEVLFNSMLSEANKQRKEEVLIFNQKGGQLVRYKPVGNSEIIQQIIRSSFANKRNNIIEKLENLGREMDYYENKLKNLNNKHTKLELEVPIEI